MNVRFLPLPKAPRKRRLTYCLLAVLAGLLFWFGLPTWLSFTPRLVASYDAGAIMLLAMLWFAGYSSDVNKTAARAATRDPGRNIDTAVVILCVLSGLLSAIVILGKGPHVATMSEKILEYGLGITAVIVGWVIIHTLFLFRYAHLYYFDRDSDQKADRGLDFPGTENPTDSDFAYFSFVIGMTFQVSDVAIKDRNIRRLALGHALLSFGYNTLIVALCINIMSGLFH
jgi:uncharacterized membrane protein